MPLPESIRRFPLDDLAPLADLIGDAHVVAIGENNHHIREFGQLRGKILRFLVTELGFRVLALESGFAEGHLVDAWISGGSGDLESITREGFTFRFGDSPEMHDMLTWLREQDGVRFAGVDLPGSGGSGLPALQIVREFLAAHAPEQAPLAAAAIEATRPYCAPNNGFAPARYAELSTEQRDAATTALARLLLAVEAVTVTADRRAHLVARHHALGALRLDEQLREFAVLMAPDPPPLVVSSRDVYQAETVRLLRALHGPDARIVLMAHNGHIQRVPFRLLPGVRARSAGTSLASHLGTDYVAIGVTAIDGVTTDARLDEQARHGIDVIARPLDPPATDSLEQAVAESGLGPTLLDLRAARGERGPSQLRHAYLNTPVDVTAAFDAMCCLPTMSPSAFVTPTS